MSRSMLARILGVLLLTTGLPADGLAQWGPMSLEWVEPAPLDGDTVTRLLTAYETGRYADFEQLAATFASAPLNPLEFEADADRWMNAAPDRRRRAFIAAAVALELASLPVQQSSHEPPAMSDIEMQQRTERRRQTLIQVGFVLAELGCAWLRDHPPLAAEKHWHAALVALARTTSREGYIVPITNSQIFFARLVKSSAGRDWPSMERSSRQNDARMMDERRRQYDSLMRRMRGSAARVSASTRINVSALVEGDHRRHLLERFPGSPLPLFVDATVRERARAAWPDTLLGGSIAPEWLDAAQADRIVKGGSRQISAVPPNLRMDRDSADRFLRVVPEPSDVVFGNVFLSGNRQPSAAFASLTLWDVVDGFRAVPAREPVASESLIRLGQSYARLGRPDLALPALARAESLASTSYERYLARLFAGATFARSGRPQEAITALQGALHAVPRAQAASFALAPLLLEVDARKEAAEILEAATKLPLADDPLSFYYDGDPTGASRALAQLRKEARP